MGQKENEITIQNLDLKDLDQTATLHMVSFPETFLSLAGTRMTKLFLKFFSESPLGVILTAEHEGRIVGYVAGAVDKQSFMKELALKKCLSVLWLLLPPLVTNPKLATMFLEKVRSLLRSEKKREQLWSIPDLPKASLMSIAVSEEYRGRGVGHALNVRFLEALSHKGVTRVRLGVLSDNTAAIRSYSKVGWEIAYQDERGTLMVLDMKKSPAVDKESGRATVDR